MYNHLLNHSTRLAIIGLGYVGLPLALAMSKHLSVIGFDKDEQKVQGLIHGLASGSTTLDHHLNQVKVEFTSDETKLASASFYIVAVPTPVRNGNVPDLSYIEQASCLIGQYLKQGDYVVYESTVYPGVTEDICLPILEKESGMKAGIDFKIGYSPERINPGDAINKLENIVKIVSGIDEEAIECIANVYQLIIDAGVHRAPSIRVAEAAKVVENAQRDVNIAFMNELAILFSHMNINTKEVLAAAGTKWNFLNFTPGLVGGHCISIDPYYLTYLAEDKGYPSNLILTSRHINDSMSKFIATKMIKDILRTNNQAGPIKVAILGVSYKENSDDIRNSKVIDVIKELSDYGIVPYVYDPIANTNLLKDHYGIETCQLEDINQVSLVAIMVPHDEFLELPLDTYFSMYDKQRDEKLFFDIKGAFSNEAIVQTGLKYWSL